MEYFFILFQQINLFQWTLNSAPRGRVLCWVPLEVGPWNFQQRGQGKGGRQPNCQAHSVAPRPKTGVRVVPPWIGPTGNGLPMWPNAPAAALLRPFFLGAKPRAAGEKSEGGPKMNRRKQLLSERKATDRANWRGRKKVSPKSYHKRGATGTLGRAATGGICMSPGCLASWPIGVGIRSIRVFRFGLFGFCEFRVSKNENRNFKDKIRNRTRIDRIFRFGLFGPPN